MWSREGEWESVGERIGGGFCVEFDGFVIFVIVCVWVWVCVGVDIIAGFVVVVNDGSNGFEDWRGFGDETELSAISFQRFG